MGDSLLVVVSLKGLAQAGRQRQGAGEGAGEGVGAVWPGTAEIKWQQERITRYTRGGGSRRGEGGAGEGARQDTDAHRQRND